MATNNLAPAPMNAFVQPTSRYPFLGGLAPQAGGSPLAKLYSYIDSMKRKGSAFTKDPLGEIAKGVQNFGEDNSKILDLQDTAYLSKSVLITPQERERARQELADYGAQVGLAGATVWHGSPHKFPPTKNNPLGEFDSTKIGTGEGAQTYGHGLYFGGERRTGETYQKALGQQKDIFVRRTEDGNYYVTKGAGDEGGILAGPFKDGSQAEAARRALPENQGHLYKVDLPDEHIAKMLDWDKPLSQQPESVRKSLGELRQQTGATYTDLAKGETVYELLRKSLQNKSGVYLPNTSAERVVAEQLQKAGIPGVRYLDGGSRGAGGGTSNYVVFPGEERLLKILERNGQTAAK